MRHALLLLLIALLPSAVARADRVPSPPADCPRGSLGHTEHAGAWCSAPPCASDAECGARHEYEFPGRPLRCVESSLCVVEERYRLGHRTPTPEFSTRHRALGRCVEGACPGEGECVTANRCVVGDAPAETEESPSIPSGVEESTASTAGPARDPEARESELEGDEEGAGGGCHASTNARTGGLALGALATLMLILRSRRLSNRRD